MRMKRLFMTADAVGGVFFYALDLAAALGKHGFETTLAVLGPPMNAAQRAAARKLDCLTLVETNLPLDWLAADEQSVFAAASAIAELADAHHAEIVHLNIPSFAIARFPAPVVVAMHSCLASWWASVKGGALPGDFEWRTRLIARALKAADAIVCPSRSFAGLVETIYGCAPIMVVHNGREAAPARSPDMDAVSAFTAGRLWDEGKNVAVLDAAAARIGLPFFAAGPLAGPNGTQIELRHLTPLGALDEAGMRARLAHRPIFVSSALYEPFGLTVLEAAQAGCALVLSDIPTFRELWQGAALFAPARDAQAFADVIGELASDTLQRADLGKLAQLRAARYGVEPMARRMAEIYAELHLRLHGAAA